MATKLPTSEAQAEPTSSDVPTTPTTEQLAEAPNWGQGGRYVINPKGERVLATEQE